MKEIRLCDDGNLKEVGKLCKNNNVGIEIQSFYDPYIESFESVLLEHKNILSEIDCGKSLHAPFWELNLGTKMKGLRKETMDMFNYAYKIAKELCCTEVVVHNGYIPGTYGYSGWIKRSAEFWNEFFQDKDDSIIMCIENQFEENCEIMKMEIDEANDSRLKICLDVGHVNANSNMSVEEWIKTLGHRIAYYHLHNNHGKQNIKGYNNDEHLGLENGTINMKSTLELAELYSPNAIWNIETNIKYLEESIENLKTMGYLKNSK